jgi:hypothetical protein
MIVETVDNFLTEKNRPLYERITNLFPEAIIAGGSARQIYLNEEFGSTDIDLYHTNYANIGRAYVAGVVYKLVSHTIWARTYLIDGIKVQLMGTPYRDIQSLFDTFDFSCCMFAISPDELMYTYPFAITDAKGKWLQIVNKQLNSEKQAKRIGKYLKKGYLPKCGDTMNVYSEFLKFAEECYTNKGDYLHTKDPTQIFKCFFGNTEDSY